MLALAIRSALILALAWGLTAMLRRSSAATRHFVWTCAIVAAALVPAAFLVFPGWRVESPVALPSLDSVTATQGQAPARGSNGSAAPPVGAGLPARGATAQRVSLDYGAIALGVWATGTAAILFFLAAGFWRARRLRRSAAPPDPRLDEDLQALGEAFGIPPFTVVASAAISTPMVCGLRRPFVLLPAGAAEWPEERRHVVLLHELAHLKRRDCLTQLVAQIVCAVYWFNPLAWVAARRLRSERERACDDFVLAAGTAGSDYAGHLLAIAQALQPARFSTIAATGLAMARRSQLEGRLMAILDPAIRRSSALVTRFAASALIVLASIPVAAVQLTSPLAVASSPPAPRQAPRAASQDERLRLALSRSLLEYAEQGDLAGVAAMLDAGADVNAKIHGDGSPLIAAADEGHLEVVRFLLDQGAEPNLVVPGDGTALIAAARQGHLDNVELLLQRGAQVNLIAETDETALIQASGEGNLDVVKLLVAKGADVNLGVWVDAESNGASRRELRTPLRQARRRGHTAVAAYLLSAGARN